MNIENARPSCGEGSLLRGQSCFEKGSSQILNSPHLALIHLPSVENPDPSEIVDLLAPFNEQLNRLKHQGLGAVLLPVRRNIADTFFSLAADQDPALSRFANENGISWQVLHATCKAAEMQLKMFPLWPAFSEPVPTLESGAQETVLVHHEYQAILDAVRILTSDKKDPSQTTIGVVHFQHRNWSDVPGNGLCQLLRGQFSLEVFGCKWHDLPRSEPSSSHSATDD